MKRFMLILGMTVSLLGFAGVEEALAQPVSGQAITSQPVTVTWSQMVASSAKAPATQTAPSGTVIPFMPTPSVPITGSPAVQPAPAPAPQPLSSGTSTTTTAKAPAGPTPLAPYQGVGFQALLDNDTIIPPDTMGAVGANYVMTMLNSQVRIQDRTGTIKSTVSLATFWSGAGANSPFDPHLVYDTLSGRWIATCAADGGLATSKVFFAISATSDPTGTWTFYSFTSDGTGNTWADYPSLGVNSTWIAIGTNMYNVTGSAFAGAKMWVIDKSTALAGGALTTTVLPTSFDGNGSTLQPAVTFDATQANLYIVDNGYTPDSGATDYFRLSEITGTATAPSWSVVPDAAGPYPGTGKVDAIQRYNATLVGAAQSGSPNLIDTGDIRILNAVFRNGHLFFAHNGGYPNEPSTATRTDIFWYEVDPLLLNTTGLPVIQSGSAYASATANSALMYPSVAVNKDNDVLIGMTKTDSSMYASAAYGLHLATDTAGVLSFNQIYKAGLAPYYKTLGTGVNRWGDYSATAVDPVNDTDFWTIQEYAETPSTTVPAPNSDHWSTWWVQVVPNSPPTASNVTVSGTATVGNVLTGSYTYNDADGDLQGTSTFRWLRNGTAITGATSKTYTLVKADSGTTIKFEVTPVALTGASPGTAVASSGTTVINSPPTASHVAISGTATAGSVLSGSYTYADVDGDLEGTSTFRWLRNGTAITGATSKTYTLVAADSGATIAFEVTPVALTGASPGTAVASAGLAIAATTTTTTTGGGGGGAIGFASLMVLSGLLLRRRRPR